MLILKGIILDTISRVSVVVAADEGIYHMDPDTTTSADLTAMISEGLTEDENWNLIGSAHDKKSTYTSTGEPLSKVYYQSIYGGRAPWPKDLVRQQHKQDTKAGRMNHFVHSFKSLQKRPKLYIGYMMALVTLDGLMSRSGDHDNIETMRMVQHNRRLANTEGGRLALLPGTAEVGDKIAVLCGGKLPHVSRKRAERWELVGECYVHGAMLGEAFEEEECYDIAII